MRRSQVEGLQVEDTSPLQKPFTASPCVECGVEAEEERVEALDPTLLAPPAGLIWVRQGTEDAQC